MTDQITLPRHLCVLRDTWAVLAVRLARDTAPAMPHTTDHIEPRDMAQCQRMTTQETESMKDWVLRVEAWLNGPLTQVLADAGTADQAMRREAARLAGFADELIKQRHVLRTRAQNMATRAIAPQLDVVYLSLLRQVRDFATGIVMALSPLALQHPAGRRRGSTLELSFTFRPDISQPLAECSALLRGTDATPGTARPNHAKASTNTSKEIWAAALVLVAFGALTAAIGPVAIIILLGVLLLALALRHPIITLLVLFFGFH